MLILSPCVHVSSSPSMFDFHLGCHLALVHLLFLPKFCCHHLLCFIWPHLFAWRPFIFWTLVEFGKWAANSDNSTGLNIGN
jgi:multisubunit Na+/H+ antiporter MnhE subunit